ncbi:TetR family transcriptional regulator C-terminal domain-containing protein [Flavobacteriaceae bacterium]|nr:TetR family transcriptional regulator C-terminal domain-containing protein [Flavobacteriaceae bacterium]
MATKKISSKKTSVIDADQIISAYMEDVLNNEKKPVTVYGFCKAHDFEEVSFYQFFGNIEALEKGVWEAFFSQTMRLLQKNPDYANTSSREKMLGFFFSFFELLTLNRSYVLFTLKSDKNMLHSLMALSGLRNHFKSFTKDLIDLDNSSAQSKLTQFQPSVFSEAAWVQLLFTIKFWMDDNSPGFEKTDILIEKSINTVFEVFNNTPLEQVLDLGKFLFKERMA